MGDGVGCDRADRRVLVVVVSKICDASQDEGARDRASQDASENDRSLIRASAASRSRKANIVEESAGDGEHDQATRLLLHVRRQAAEVISSARSPRQPAELREQSLDRLGGDAQHPGPLPQEHLTSALSARGVCVARLSTV